MTEWHWILDRHFTKTFPLQKDNENTKITDLMERLAYMECDREKLSKESHELREQNELLEFRIIELEESHDKVSSFRSDEILNFEWNFRRFNFSVVPKEYNKSRY